MSASKNDKPAPQQIDDIIKLYGGWKGEILTQLRSVIKQADPEVAEEVKWKMASRPEGVPAWYHDGIVCIAETWKDNIKLLFFKGAQLQDPHKLFNARLKSKDVRAIEFREGDVVDEAAFKEIIREAVRLNGAAKSSSSSRASRKT